MITYIRTIALLTIASVWVNHSRATGLDITWGDWSTVAPEARSGEQADFTDRGAPVRKVIDLNAIDLPKDVADSCIALREMLACRWRESISKLTPRPPGLGNVQFAFSRTTAVGLLSSRNPMKRTG